MQSPAEGQATPFNVLLRPLPRQLRGEELRRRAPDAALIHSTTYAWELPELFK